MNLKTLARVASPILSRTVLPLVRSRGLPGTACLLYHEADQDRFRSHVRYLKQHYDVISVETLVESLQTGAPPEDAVVLTFDDGYRSVYENVLPVAEAEQVPVSIFVSTDHIFTDEPFWWDKADQVREHDTTFRSNRELKQLPESKRRTLVDSQFKTISADYERTTLSPSEVQALANSDYTTVHPHSKSHPRLTTQSHEKANEEIRRSRHVLREEFGCDANVFSFPDGAYNEAHVSMVREVGYDGALTLVPGLNTAETDPYHVPRISLCGVREPGCTTTTFNASRVPTMALAVHGTFRRLARKRFKL